MIETRPFLVSLFDAAIAAADPKKSIARHLPDKPKGRTLVVGAGKGSAQMAQALEELWGDPLEGFVVTRYGYGAKCSSIEVMEANHPVPDANGLAAANRAIELVTGLTEDDLVLALICGGGSALLPSPAGVLSLDDEIRVNEVLLESGAPITVMNTIRKHISNIKGGRLAEMAHPAKVVSLIVSDIPGDDPAQVASGPTVPDHASQKEALAAIARYRMELPSHVLDHIASSRSVCPSPDDPIFARNEIKVIASASVSLEAAAEAACDQGIEAVILSDSIEGEAREIAKMHAALALEIANRDRPFHKPVVLLSGGETTVTLAGNGKGGRNTEFLLSFAAEIDGISGVSALAADTDGIDGSQDNAGAFADGSSIARMREKGIDPIALLLNNDAWSAFDAIGDLFVPGPTGTNVNDLRAILIS